MKDHFEELIQTIERNAVDNKATITNVFLWAESWRAEREMDIQHELDRIKKQMKETPYLRYSPLREFVNPEDHPIPHAVDVNLASELYRANQDSHHCHDDFCAYSSTVGKLIEKCEKEGCILKNKEDGKESN